MADLRRLRARAWFLASGLRLCRSTTLMGGTRGVTAVVSFAVGIALFGIPQFGFAQPGDAERAEFFEKQVRPLLIEQCHKCHSGANPKAGLDLTSRTGLRRGGDGGAVLSVDQSAKSRLLQTVNYQGELKMPPSGKLSSRQIEILTQWVNGGAWWPEEEPGRSAASGPPAAFEPSEDQRRWWAFQPVRPVTPPSVSRPDWARGDLDLFVLAGLETQGLSPAAPASRRTWLRRVTFGLTGLPPTPAEVAEFEVDEGPEAEGRVVDRLLASPAYGERWARHWLDVARYADYYDANPATRTASCELTEAWRYRDWVVESLNGDLPHDEFIRLQVAGDLLPAPPGEEIHRAGLVATTFLSNGVWDRGDADKEKIVSDMVDDNIDTIGKAFMGLTLGCARCHDHKFDPVSTADYYSLAGIFYSTHILKELGTKGGEYTLNRVPLWGPTALARRTEQQRQQAAAMAELANLDRQHRLESLSTGGQVLKPARFMSEAGAEGSVSEDGTVAVSGSRAKDRYRVVVELSEPLTLRSVRLEVLPDASLPQSGPGRADDGNFVLSRFSVQVTRPGAVGETVRFHKARADFEQEKYAVATALQDDLKQGWGVSPRIGERHVAVFECAEGVELPAGSLLEVSLEQRHSEQLTLGRFRLWAGDAVADSPPPRTARRMELEEILNQAQRDLSVSVPLAMAVGEGGTAGGLFPAIQDVPIHIRGSYARLGAVVPRGLPRFLSRIGTGEGAVPIAEGSGRRELAEWVASPRNPLTARVIVNRIWQWHMGEGLVRTPNNFGLLSQPPSHPELLDWLAAKFVEEGWSWKSLHRRIVLSATYRQGSRRSDGADERDPENHWLGRMVSRRLEAEAIRDAMLSVSGRLDRGAGGPAGDDFTINRRSLYVQTARWQRESYANLFDAANSDASTERRATSTVAPQALLMLNHPFLHEMALGLAERWQREVPGDEEARVSQAWRLMYGREPTDAERKVAWQVIRPGGGWGDKSGAAGGADAERVDGLARWIDLAHVLLCSNEFIYVD